MQILKKSKEPQGGQSDGQGRGNTGVNKYFGCVPRVGRSNQSDTTSEGSTQRAQSTPVTEQSTQLTQLPVTPAHVPTVPAAGRRSSATPAYARPDKIDEGTGETDDDTTHRDVDASTSAVL